MNLIWLHRDRRMVPRWRQVQARESYPEERPLELGVLRPLNPAARIELEDTIRRWSVKREFGTAVEILNSSRNLEGNPVVEQAIILVQATANVTTLARSLAMPNGAPSPIAESRHGRSISGIVESRAALRRDPYNAFAAMNLAHAYCGIGLVDKAERLIRHALAVAGTNRTILRGAARFYLHIKDYERAHRILARAPSLLQDPWLLAGELALAEVVGKTSQHVKKAKRIAELESLAPIHRAELNAAIGDVQVHRGEHKHARNSYIAALVKPTENVVAQAHFLSTHGQVTNLPMDNAMKSVISAPEAFGMDAILRGDWKVAKSEARRWLEFEPFSSRPANLGFTASEMGDNDMESAAFFAKWGQLANPGQPMQHNNYAFALAKLGRVEEAERAFDVCRSILARESGDTGERSVYKATAGLIAWRRNDFEAGRRGYSEAVEYFEKMGLKPRLTVALWRWAEEEVRVGNILNAAKLLERAKAVVKPKERTFQHVAVDNFEELLKSAMQVGLTPTKIETTSKQEVAPSIVFTDSMPSSVKGATPLLPRITLTK